METYGLGRAPASSGRSQSADVQKSNLESKCLEFHLKMSLILDNMGGAALGSVASKQEGLRFESSGDQRLFCVCVLSGWALSATCYSLTASIWGFSPLPLTLFKENWYRLTFLRLFNLCF